METISYSLHRFFTPFLPSSFVSVLWDRQQLKAAIKAGPSHPKYIGAKNLVDKIRAGEAHLCRRTAMDLGYLEAVKGQGWRLTPKGDAFVRKQMSMVKGSENPCLQAQWGTEVRSMITLMERTFDVIIYHPKHQSEAGRLFAFLHGNADIDQKVEATIKVLVHDEDQVDSEEQDEPEVSDYDGPELVDHTSDDEVVEEENSTPLMLESDPRTLQERILDEYIEVKGGKDSAALMAMLFEVVEQRTEFGSDKDYFELPTVGEFELEKPGKDATPEQIQAYTDELARYQAYRLESLRNGYSDEPNYEFLDLDIPSFEEDRVQVATQEHFSPEFKAELKKAYLQKLEELKDLDSPNKVMRDAYLTVVHTMGEGKFEEVAKALV